MSIRRLRLRSFVTLVPAALGLCISALAGCGGGATTEAAPKTTEQAKTEGAPASPAKEGASTEVKAPEGAAPAPAVKAAGPKEKEPENPPKDHKDMSVGLIYRIKGLN
ncbi:hypothetical protein [Polyangium spumosum]|uniref:Uncharacterized protein n=1 Tax=Polyangium spumosum TaxID=889282 RepID=A0A6N7PRL5_9BACT|nr:hypothetical protein [Polyangium spumosum]MRG94688.1 hypothetical protein [Polyangium spumosum]